MLIGYRTYISALAIGVLAGLHALGIVGDSTYQTLLAVVGAGGLASLRAAVGK